MSVSVRPGCHRAALTARSSPDGDPSRSVPAAAQALDRRAAIEAIAGALVALAAFAPQRLALAGGALNEERATEDGDSAVRTAKERLGSKAADEQRVDNCKVPLELRGSKPRPDDCGPGRTRQR